MGSYRPPHPCRSSRVSQSSQVLRYTPSTPTGRAAGLQLDVAYWPRPCENSTRYNRTRNFEACGHAQSKKMQKFPLRSALQSNQISFSHGLGQKETFSLSPANGQISGVKLSRRTSPPSENPL